MAYTEQGAIESPALARRATQWYAEPHAASCTCAGHRALTPHPRRLQLDADGVKNGLGQLVLTLVKLLHELLEKQALRRIEAGSLTADQIERLGLTLMRQAEEIDRLRQTFNLEDADLNLDLGPLGKLL